MIPRRTPVLCASNLFSFATLVALVFGLLPLGAAHAQTLTWTGAANGTTFNLAGNWSPAAAPGPTHDCVIPAGAGTINVGGTSVRSITTARNLFVEACTTVNLTGGLTLQSGAIVQIDNTGGCSALVFKGGAQSIAGSGSIFISSEGNGGRAISVQDACTLTIESGVAIGYGPSTWGTSAQLYIEAGSSIASASTISVQQAGLTLSIAGPGSFTNSGTLKADAGTLNLQAGSWRNSGAVQIASGAVAGFGGSFASLGSVVNSGGTVKVTGAANSSTITATASTGPITLAGATLVACTLQSADGTGFVTDGTCTLSGCTVGANLTLGSCSKILVTNSLTLANNALVMIGDTCTGPPLEFRSGNQFIHGSGTIQLRKDDSNDDRALRLTTQVTLTIDAGITISSSIGTGTQSMVVDGGCTLINYGTIVTQSGTFRLNASSPGARLTNNGTISASGGSFSLDASGVGAQFANNGTLAFANASVSEIKGDVWSNTSSITLDSANLSASGDWINSGTIVATGSTFTTSGLAWLNNGGASFTNCSTIILANNWTNAGSINASGGTLRFWKDWSNQGAVNTTDAALTLSGTFASLGTLNRTGGVVSLEGQYTGSMLVATTQTGDLVLDGLLMNGATLLGQGANLIFSSPTLTDCTIASDVSIGAARRMTVLGTLTLANNAAITLGTPSPGGNASGIFLNGGAPLITGTGTIRVLQSTTLFTFSNASNLTLGPAVTLALGPSAFTNTQAQTAIPTGSSITNKGTITVAQTGCKLRFTGVGQFKNEGTLNATGGTIEILNLSGPVGAALISSGASLSLDGNYTINQPIDCHGSLSLAGTWTNNSTISVTAGALTLGGTWTNAGTFALNGSTWTIGGTYTSEGNFTAVATSRTYYGAFPGNFLAADTSTGDIFLAGASFTNATLHASGGAAFRHNINSTSLTLNGCTLAGPLIASACSPIIVSNSLILDDATISLASSASCGNAALRFDSGIQTITGTGQVLIKNSLPTSASLQISNNASLTIAEGVSIICPPDAPTGGAISVSSFATFSSSGRISMQRSAGTLILSGGTFLNAGTVESLAGSLSISPTTLSNYDAATFKLSRGKWIANFGALTIGSRPVRIIASDAEVSVAGAVAIFNLSGLHSIAGTLRISSTTLPMTPSGGTLTNTGLLDIAKGGVLDVTGNFTLDPACTLRTELAGTLSSQFGRVKASAKVTIAGHLTGKFSAPYVPVAGNTFTPFLSGAPVVGAFSDVCFEENPQHMGIVQNLITLQMRLIVSAASGTPPAITQQPQNTNASPDAVFTVAAAPTGVTFQWRKGEVTLTDGPTPSGSTISGSQTATLTIHNAHPEDAGSYSSLVSNSCGSTLSDPATLSVCTGDLNADGLVDDADFVLFLAGYNILDCADPAMPANCPADLNNDAVVDDTDFQLFVPAYDTLICP